MISRLGLCRTFHKTFIKIQFLRSQVEAGGLRLPGISFLYKVHSLHKVSR